MFGFGKKKVAEAPVINEVIVNDPTLYAPLAGQVLDLSEVSDPVFSQKMMGDGFAIEPTDGHIVSPVAGKVTMLQGHAVGLKRADGLEVLVHLGIDTVALNGAPFSLNVAEGQILEGGQEIGTADWAQVEAAGMPKTTMVLITNTADALADLSISATGTVAAGDIVGQATAK